MNAEEIVLKMFRDFEAKTGKPPTEIRLAPALFDSLHRELETKVNQFAAQKNEKIKVDWMKLHGVLIQRANAEQAQQPSEGK